MQQFIDMLGHKFEDCVTGFKGVAESVSFDLYGCVQVALRPPMQKPTGKNDDGYPDGRWFDASRLKKTSQRRVMELPAHLRTDQAGTPEPKKPVKAAEPNGPADKMSIR